MNENNNFEDYLTVFKDCLESEANALLAAKDRLKPETIKELTKLFQYHLGSGATLFISGIGKSGDVGKKIASTFRSLGLKSVFLHPVEALHGDLGLFTDNDSMVYISKSGTAEELLKLDTYLNIPKNRKISMTANLNSPLAQKSGIVMDCAIEREACLNNQAPTTSTTLTLAMGDAMAVLFEKVSNLSKEEFAVNHPSGILGKALRVKVENIYWKLEDCPVVGSDANLSDVLLKMTNKNLGGCAIVEEKKLKGLIVEGDIRRSLNKTKSLEVSVSDVMTKNPVTITPDELASTALDLMENRENQIAILPVVDKDSNFLGFIRIHDLLKEGFSLKS
ncbi:MAG: KpsF/GutQ family sugar-phosphate isomerase [Bacteriovoracaceae bacterium]